MAKKQNFESALKTLQGAVESLENDDLSLEASLARFEEGVKSAALCRQLLKEVEVRVEQLTQTPDGGFSARPFTQD